MVKRKPLTKFLLSQKKKQKTRMHFSRMPTLAYIRTGSEILYMSGSGAEGGAVVCRGPCFTSSNMSGVIPVWYGKWGARAGEHPYLVGGGPGSGPEGVPVCGKEGGRHMYGDPPPQQTDRHN